MMSARISKCRAAAIERQTEARRPVRRRPRPRVEPNRRPNATSINAPLTTFLVGTGTFGASFESSWTTITGSGITRASGTSSSSGHPSSERVVLFADVSEWAEFSFTIDQLGRNRHVRVWNDYALYHEYRFERVVA